VKQVFEVHDARDPEQSLFKDIKQQRKQSNMPPLPPHQSFTYYDPTDPNFRPGYFSPGNLTNSQKDEVIGIRVDAKDALVNRILLNETGSALVFYGFATLNEANDYVNQLNQKPRWMKNAAELKKHQQNGYYNEAMLRAQWVCDGSSQLLIYPPHDSVAGRYMAILHRLDMENHLRQNEAVYRKPPFNWTPDYQVPISFWSNDTQSSLYRDVEQQADLKQSTGTTRVKFLKAAILFMQEPQQLNAQLKDELQPLFDQGLSGDKSAWLDNFALLNWSSKDLMSFYAIFIEKSPLENINAFLKSIDINRDDKRLISVVTTIFTAHPELMSQPENMIIISKIISNTDDERVVRSLITAAKKSHDPKALEQMLLSKHPANGSAYAFRRACLKGHIDVVNALLSAASDLKIMNPNDHTLEQMLLAESPEAGPACALKLACQNGHTDVVNALISAALELKNKDSKNCALEQMLLAEYPGYGPASAFKEACYRRHIDVVNALISAASKLNDQNSDNDTLEKMLLAKHPNYEQAYAFRKAHDNFYPDVVAALISAASGLKEKKGDDSTLEKMLSSVYGGKVAILARACVNGHTDVVKALISAESKDNSTLGEMLLAAHPGVGGAYAFAWACDHGKTDVISLLLSTAKRLKVADDIKAPFDAFMQILVDKKYTSITDTNLIAECLNACLPETRKKWLSILNKELKPEQKQSLVKAFAQAVRAENSEQVKSTYADKAGFFSLTRLKMRKGKISNDELKKTLENRASKNLEGASMETLLEITKSSTPKP
jgi:ankyrin repeat protein